MCAVTINGTEYPFATILARRGKLQKRGDTWHLRFPHEAERAVTLDLTLAEHIRRARELHQLAQLQRRRPVYERKAFAWAHLKQRLDAANLLTVPGAVVLLQPWDAVSDVSNTRPLFPQERYPQKFAKV